MQSRQITCALQSNDSRATNRSQKPFKVPRQREIFGVLAIIKSVFLPAKKALSTLLGGPWIWRYHAVLLELAEAQVYGDKAMKKAANNWLTDVSRIQAHLGVLRLWKSGLWAGISGVAIGFFGWKISSFSQTTGLTVGIIGLAVAIACNAIYWAKDPDPY